MKTEIIKPEKENKNNSSLLTPIIYLIIGVILAFFSNQAVRLIFYIIGIMVIIYGIKLFLVYYQNKDKSQYSNINLGLAIISVVGGLLLIFLSESLEISIRYVLGFFLIYMGISRGLTQFSLGECKLPTIVSSVLFIIGGVYSIFKSNAVLMIIGWLLIANSILLFWEYLKR
mgnify:CR=1 FL=1